MSEVAYAEPVEELWGAASPIISIRPWDKLREEKVDMRTVDEHEFTTYPRRFDAYKWYKPLLVGLLFAVLCVASMGLVDLLTKLLFGATISGTGYDDMDFYSTAGAFYNGGIAAAYVPALILAALAVKDRPLSSYFSSMGGWRWKTFLKTLVAAFVFLGLPTIVMYLLKGRVTDVRFTLGGFIFLTLLASLQSIGEEMVCRGYIMQTVSSWFMLPIAGMIAQTIAFTVVHPYNIIGVVEIAVSAVLYALICITSKGLEAPSALHIANNMSEIYMTGFGFGMISSEQTIPGVAFNLFFKVLYFLFILYASKKLHWFDEVQRDDVASFNAKKKR